jgi:hypothetical protein
LPVVEEFSLCSPHAESSDFSFDRRETNSIRMCNRRLMFFTIFIGWIRDDLGEGEVSLPHIKNGYAPI